MPRIWALGADGLARILRVVRQAGGKSRVARTLPDMGKERRQHRRLAIRLPLECCPEDAGPEWAVRTVTGNISTGGLYFELDVLDEGIPAPERHSVIDVEITVPPGDGHFPYEGRVRTAAEVVRCDRLPDAGNRKPDAPPRVGIGARFREPLKLVF